MDSRLRYTPVALFASVMGLTGLSIAYQRFEQVFKLEWDAAALLLMISWATFLVLIAILAYRLVAFFPEVSAEFRHPVQGSFFPAISIGLLLLGAATIRYWEGLAYVTWLAGTGLHFVLTLAIVNRWMEHDFEIAYANPVWFLPVVGNILVPIAGVTFADSELLWFFFTIGFFFWLVLFVIIFYRLIFHPQLPEKLLSTQFILVAPPAVGFVSYIALTGTYDHLARMLLYISVFLLILLVSSLRRFLRLDYYVSWWAYTFPLCAVTIAVTTAYSLTGNAAFGRGAQLALALTTVIVLLVAARTIQAIIRKKICVQE
ncbi:MAG: SLAC1 anion channel family protein [Negativicutes bacterium]|nr:SLAC1 anion channel family protein [Negativicutes bacterium]MDR3591225.1 SLAC1 anion channel family protein [Negativicutes bacterium]